MKYESVFTSKIGTESLVIYYLEGLLQLK